jgi:hypothetical protein
MHFISDEALREFAFPVFAWLNKYFPSRCSGRQKKQKGLLAISFYKFSQTEILPTKTKNASRNERKTSKYFCHSSSCLLSENCYVYFRLQKCVCKILGSFFQYFSRYKCMGFAMAPVFQYHSIPFRKYRNLILRIYFPVALY